MSFLIDNKLILQFVQMVYSHHLNQEDCLACLWKSYNVLICRQIAYMNKQDLRKTFIQKRKALSSQAVRHASHMIQQHFFQNIPVELQKTVHIFLPIIKKNEIDTWLIINTLFQHYPQIQVATSKAHLQQGTLSHYFLTPDTQLAQNAWGINEPVDAPPCPIEQIDMVLVPLLCFDKQGHRVGYGKGFYDRFLAQCRPDIYKIGMSLFSPVACIDDIQTRDIALDCCITPDQIIQCAESHA